MQTEVIEEITENVDTATEETVEEVDFTDTAEEEVETTESEETEEVKEDTVDEQKKIDEIVEKRLARERRKAEREKAEALSKYQSLENILNTALGTKDISEATEQLKAFYEGEGVKFSEVSNKPGLSDREIEILARAEAEEISELGYSEMEREANQLAERGFDNLTKKEQIVFKTLAEKLTLEKQKKDLSKNGISHDILDDKDFKEFASKFKEGTSLVEIYNLYKPSKPKGREIGDLGTTDNKKTKDFYTKEEADKLTEADYDRDPGLLETVRKSMLKW